MKRFLLLGAALSGVVLTGALPATGTRRFGSGRLHRPDTVSWVTPPDRALCGRKAIGIGVAGAGSGGVGAGCAPPAPPLSGLSASVAKTATSGDSSVATGDKSVHR